MLLDSFVFITVGVVSLTIVAIYAIYSIVD